MWGFKNYLNRKLADKMFSLIIDKDLAKQYNEKRDSPKGNDQFFLGSHVYDLIKTNSVVHDSYLCENYRDSKPWPTQRVGNCFVGSPGDCNATATDFYDCPDKCKPRNHLDWKKC